MINNDTTPYGAALLRIALGMLFLVHVRAPARRARDSDIDRGRPAATR